MAQGSARVRGAIEHFFPRLFRHDQFGLGQLAKGVIDGMRVVDIQKKADIAQSFVTATMVHIVKDQDFQWAHVGMTCGRHAFHHPARERVECDDKAKLELRRFPTFAIGEVPGGYNFSFCRVFHDISPINYMCFHTNIQLRMRKNRNAAGKVRARDVGKPRKANEAVT